MSFSPPADCRQPNPFNPPPPQIYATNSPPKLPNTEDNDEGQADAVEQAFDLDYEVAQAFCSHIVPKDVLLFTGEALDNGMYFEPEDGDEYDSDKGRYDKVR